MLIGHSALRGCVMGFDNRPPTPEELSAMEKRLDEELSMGAFGMSLGLIYTAYFLRFIQLVSMLYDCRNIIALCALKTNITQNMGRPHCAATLILILL